MDTLNYTTEELEVIAEVLDAHYEETIQMQKDHYLNDDTDYFDKLMYLQELIDKTMNMINE
jgi:hypothetical protein|tara:strand:- start:118 stop:300 length:183 start_codon:yes stop_codon:yes gene_type:complete